MRTADDAVGEAGLVLKQDDISVAAAGEHILKICVRQPAVCAAPDENAVLSAGVDLNDSVTGGNVKLEQMTGIRSGFFEQRGKKAAVRADRAAVDDLRAGTRCGDRLVKALSACKDRVALCGNGLSRTDKFLDSVNVINVQRTEIKYLHGFPPVLKQPSRRSDGEGERMRADFSAQPRADCCPRYGYRSWSC